MFFGYFFGGYKPTISSLFENTVAVFCDSLVKYVFLSFYIIMGFRKSSERGPSSHLKIKIKHRLITSADPGGLCSRYSKTVNNNLGIISWRLYERKKEKHAMKKNMVRVYFQKMGAQFIVDLKVMIIYSTL